jgi:uncharacterized repeat protein (TIGR01451 family)
MQSSTLQFTRTSLALLLFAALAVAPQVRAAGTAAGTTISNLATVNYNVGGVAQAPIGSSPSGNSAGAGTATTFLVDNKVNLTLTEVTGGPTSPVAPGSTNDVTIYKLTNTGNAAEAYTLTPANVAGGTPAGGAGFGADNQDMLNTGPNPLRVFVSVAACSGASATPAYNAGTDTATSIASLAADACKYVFIVADAPAAAVNGQFASVRLSARSDVNNTPGTAEVQTAGADTSAVDVVFADAVGINDATAARDGQASTLGQYAFVSAAIAVAKTSAVISDPFNGAINPKAIPGGVIEYTITVTNTGATATTAATLQDAIPANSTYVASSTSLNGGAVADVAGVMPFVAARAINSPAAASGVLNVGAGNAATVKFRVTIN